MALSAICHGSGRNPSPLENGFGLYLTDFPQTQRSFFQNPPPKKKFNLTFVKLYFFEHQYLKLSK